MLTAILLITGAVFLFFDDIADAWHAARRRARRD